MARLFDLKRFRKENHFKQKEIAEWFKCGQSNISMLEKSMGLTEYQIAILQSKTAIDISKYEINNISGFLKENTPLPGITLLSKDVLENILLNLSETIKSQQETIQKQQLSIQKFVEQIGTESRESFPSKENASGTEVFR